MRGLKSMLAASLLLAGLVASWASQAGADVQGVIRSHLVPLNCPFGDQRTTADASVQPGVIVADTSGWPFVPVTYTAFSLLDGTLQPIGNFSTIATTDHLVAAWQNSTNCYGSSISRNSWVADSSGAVIGEDDFSGPAANNFGDMAGHPLNQPVDGMSPTSDANGYWLVASDGGIFAFGDAGFYGSMGGHPLNKPMTAMAVTPDGQGYWMVASDGGVFAFGDAGFYGSTGSLVLNKPIEGMAATPDGQGYWMVASDGGVFCFGDAPFLGSLGGQTLSAPIAGMIPNGSGYTLIGQDGQTYPFG